MDLLKLLIIFILIVVFLGLKKPLYLVIIGATVLLGLLFRMRLADFFATYGRSLISYDTINFTVIIWLVMLVEGLMTKYGYLQRILGALDSVFNSRKFDMISMPMIIGFLPSAGGALFSCPMVAEAAKDTGISPERQSVVNIYYRHVMEIFFPTYPSLLLAAQISGLPLANLTLYVFPLALFVAALGLVYVKGVTKLPKVQHKNHLPARIGALLFSLWPFLLLIALILAGGLEIWLSVAIVLAMLLLAIRPAPKSLPGLIRDSTKWRLLLMLATVMGFKDMLTASGAVERLPELIAALPVPPVLVFSLMSFFLSLLTGVPVSATAIVMPLAIAALPAYTVPVICLLHLSAYLGAQLTPMHMCITITAEYFQANLQKVLLLSALTYVPIYLLTIAVYGYLLP